MQTTPPFISFGRRSRAFSLVEVVIAIGIISFAMIALLGLLGSSLSTSKHARNDTVLASLAQRVLSETMTNTATALSTLSATEYFTEDGFPTNNLAAVYKCTISGQPLTAANYTLPLGNTTSGLSYVRITFSWPVAAAQPNVQTFQTVLPGN
jgi:uncharacterized protein (TIGR02598 family)